MPAITEKSQRLSTRLGWIIHAAFIYALLMYAIVAYVIFHKMKPVTDASFTPLGLFAGIFCLGIFALAIYYGVIDRMLAAKINAQIDIRDKYNLCLARLVSGDAAAEISGFCALAACMLGLKEWQFYSLWMMSVAALAIQIPRFSAWTAELRDQASREN